MRRLYLDILIVFESMSRRFNLVRSRAAAIVLLALFTGVMITAGCSGLSSDDEDNTGITSAVIGTIGGSNQTILNGLNAMSSEDLAVAEQELVQTVNSESASAVQKAQAQAGLGWINLKKSERNEAEKYFSAGAEMSADALAGYAAINASSADASKDHLVLAAMEKAGLKDVTKKIAFTVNHGMTEADTRALMAYYYALVGDVEAAKYQYQKALELNSGDAMAFSEVLKVLDVVE
jgi:tetratricopeptide (TPR) repeat protein